MTNANNSILENKVEIDVNIKERLEKILKTIKNKLKSIYSKKDSLEESIYSLKEQMFDFACLLEQLSDFRKEFFDFLKIEKMVDYILDNLCSISFNQSSIIFESIYKFSDLIFCKIDSLESNYQEKYNEFSLYLKETKRYFYLNICEYDDKFDDTMIKVSKVLLS